MVELKKFHTVPTETEAFLLALPGYPEDAKRDNGRYEFGSINNIVFVGFPDVDLHKAGYATYSKEHRAAIDQHLRDLNDSARDKRQSALENRD